MRLHRILVFLLLATAALPGIAQTLAFHDAQDRPITSIGLWYLGYYTTPNASDPKASLVRECCFGIPNIYYSWTYLYLPSSYQFPTFPTSTLWEVRTDTRTIVGTLARYEIRMTSQPTSPSTEQVWFTENGFTSNTVQLIVNSPTRVSTGPIDYSVYSCDSRWATGSIGYVGTFFVSIYDLYGWLIPPIDAYEKLDNFINEPGIYWSTAKPGESQWSAVYAYTQPPSTDGRRWRTVTNDFPDNYGQCAMPNGETPMPAPYGTVNPPIRAQTDTQKYFAGTGNMNYAAVCVLKQAVRSYTDRAENYSRTSPPAPGSCAEGNNANP